MKRSSKKLVALIATLAAITSQAATVDACGGRVGFSGGYRGVFGNRVTASHPSVPYNRSVSYATPSHVYGHPNLGTTENPYAAVPQRVLSSPPQQQHFAPQPTVQPSMSQAMMSQASALSQQMPVPGTLSSSQANLQANPSDSMTRSVAVAPATQGAAQQTQSQTTAPSQPSLAPEQSALQMLASLAGETASAEPMEGQAAGIPQFAPPVAQTPQHLGTWQADLPNQASVQLRLGDDGTFQWSATQQGKVSTFAGEYRLEAGRLMLVRNGDRQQLNGNWTGDTQSGFRFKLDGAQDAGLDFRRI